MAALEDEDGEIRNYALWALNDDDPKARGGIRAFKEQGKEIPLEPLLRLLNDPDEYIVKSTLDVLGELGSLGVIVPLEPLISLVSLENTFIARAAIQALCKFGERAPVDALLTKMYDTDNEEVRDSIFDALSSLETRIPLEALLAALPDTIGREERWRVEFTLDNLAEAMPEEILKRLYDDPDPLIRRLV